MSALSHPMNKCYITGDFNINLLNYESHSETAVFLNEAYSLHFYLTITRSTRYISRATLTDNIFVNILTDNYLSGLFVSYLSDHRLIFYIVRDKINNSSLSKYFVKTYRDINGDAIALFATAIANIFWDNVVVPEDVSASYIVILLVFSLQCICV